MMADCQKSVSVQLSPVSFAHYSSGKYINIFLYLSKIPIFFLDPGELWELYPQATTLRLSCCDLAASKEIVFPQEVIRS